MSHPLKNKERDFHLGKTQKILDHIIQKDSRDMNDINDNTVSLIVTSPPYNVNKDYGKYKDKSGLEEYLSFLDEVWKECYRILRQGGRLCINVANIGRSPYIPLEAYISKRCIDIGFFMRGQILWDKGASVGASTAWGSWLSPSNPTLRDVHEYILVFSKGTNQLKKALDSDSSDITKDEFLNYGKSIWVLNTANAKQIGHPAPFPIELPYRCIKLYTYPGDLVVDPFLGSGTTCIAAKNTGRHWIGYDIEKKWVNLAKRRISESSQLDLKKNKK
ncbi:MAG: site-specific DNA-methyltransferase [archaeon]|nr:site-specific DNA-methyltransferase [archaeon]